MPASKILTVWNDEAINKDDLRILRTPSKDVILPYDEATKKDIRTLIDSFLERDDASGLAAPQIGINKRIFIFRNKGFDNDGKEWTQTEKDCDLLVNPRITQTRGEPVAMSEGCLSCPDMQVQVYRHPEIKVRFFDAQGNKINKRYMNYFARVVQHEMDHLEGILIIDYMDNFKIPRKKRGLLNGLTRSKT